MTYLKFGNTAISLVLAALAVGCETKAQSGALLGALGGAAVGAAIGNNNGSTAGGAAIGGVVGGLGGAVVGNEMDKSDERKARERERQRYEQERYDYEARREPAYTYEPPAGSAAPRLGTRDVIDWTDRGVKDEIIIDRIRQSGQVFRLTAADENQLRDAGVSSAVIRAMKATARR